MRKTLKKAQRSIADKRDQLELHLFNRRESLKNLIEDQMYQIGE